MERMYRRSAAARGGLFAALIIAAGACASSAGAQPFRQPRQSNERCYNANFLNRTIAPEDGPRCSEMAGDVTQPGLYLVYASYHAGRAYALAGDNERAKASLLKVSDFKPQREAGNTQPELRFVLTRLAAEMELARVYLRQGLKKEAADHAGRAYAGYSAYHSNPTYTHYRDEALNGRIDATLLVVRVQREMPPREDLLAYYALNQLLSDSSLNGVARTREARVDLRDTSIALGNSQLAERTQESLRNARAFFTVALNAATQLGDDEKVKVPDVYIKLGEVHMASGNLKGPFEPKGCEGNDINAADISLAREQFHAAASRDSREALLWRGCAQMGLGDLNGALESFGSAQRDDYPEPYLSLGRAHRKKAESGSGEQDWDRSRVAFRKALEIMTPPRGRQVKDEATRAQAHTELADVSLAYAETLGLSDNKRSAAVVEARRNLDSATDLLKRAPQLSQREAEAYLRLAELQIAEPSFPESTARDNIRQARTRVRGDGLTAISARASFLTSKLEQRRRSWSDAINAADQAVEIGGDMADGGYHAQACEVRLVSGLLRGGERFCKASDGRDARNLTEALLREGVYYLRVGTGASGRSASTAWDNAYKAFDRGTGLAPQFSNAPPRSKQDVLAARLLAGKGLAMICSGLDSVGTNIINVNIPQDLRVESREYFRGYGIRCAQ